MHISNIVFVFYKLALYIVEITIQQVVNFR